MRTAKKDAESLRGASSNQAEPFIFHQNLEKPRE